MENEKGAPVTLAGTIYRRKPKAKSGKRNVRTATAPRKRLRLTGSGDYNYSYKGDTPFAGVGKHLGQKVSKYLGYDISKWTEILGHGIGRILGSGDYRTGPMVRSNVLVNSTEVPQFGAIGRANVIVHREYIGDVVTSATIGGFKNEVFKIQPGDAKTFPWLSSIAENYEQYRIHGMVFYFKSTSGDSIGSTNTALGTVIMSTEYNVNSPAYLNKFEMENAQYAQSGKASVSMMHGIECDISDRPVSMYFTRTGELANNDQIKWYDFANFQIATNGFQAANVNIGELWVSYVVEFFKPQVPRTAGGEVNTALVRRNNPDAANPLGLIQLEKEGTLGCTATGNQLVVSGVLPGQYYEIIISWNTSAAPSAFTAPVMSFVGCAALGIGPLDPTGAVQLSSLATPNAGVVCQQSALQVFFNVLENNHSGQITLNLGTFVFAFGASTMCTVYIHQVSETITL